MDGSPVSMVFAVPELLEQIFLYVHDSKCVKLDIWIHDERKQLPIMCRTPIQAMQTSRQLFVLQRVNRTFRSTILGSVKIKRLMGLQYEASNASLFSETGVELSDLLGLVEPDPSWCKVVGGTPKIVFGLTVDHSSPRQVKPNRACKQSWYDVKICKTRSPIRIIINVDLYDEDPPIRDLWYTESRSFSDGEGTLGEVVEMFQRINRRSMARHWLEAKRQCINPEMVRSVRGVLLGTFFFMIALSMVYCGVMINPNTTPTRHSHPAAGR